MKRTAITLSAVAMLAMPAVLSAQGQPKNLQIGPNTAEIKFGGTATLSGKLTGQNNSGRSVTVERDICSTGRIGHDGSWMMYTSSAPASMRC